MRFVWEMLRHTCDGRPCEAGRAAWKPQGIGLFLKVFAEATSFFLIHLKHWQNSLFNGKRQSFYYFMNVFMLFNSQVHLSCWAFSKKRRGGINRSPWKLNGWYHVSTLWSSGRFYRAESLVWRDNDKQNITGCIKHQKLVFIWINQLLIDFCHLFKYSETHTKAVATMHIKVLHTQSLCKSRELHRSLSPWSEKTKEKSSGRSGL